MPIRLGNSSEATFAVNDRGVVVAWNAAAERLLGYSAQQVIGMPCHELMHGINPSGAPRCVGNCPVLEACRQGTAARRFEMVVPRADGTEVWVEVVTVTVYDAQEPLSIHVLAETPSERHLESMARRIADRYVPKTENDVHLAQEQSLTARELAVLQLLADGIRTDEIAERLNLTRNTVRNHVQNIIAKLEVHSRVEAVVAAVHRGLVRMH